MVPLRRSFASSCSRSRRRGHPAPCAAVVGSAFATIALILAACAQRTSEPPSPSSRPSDAAVRVVNYTAAEVRVETRDRPLGMVAPGAEQLFVGLEPGTHDLRARSVDGVLDFRRDLLTLERGETFTWILREAVGDPAAAADVPAGGGATVVVENGTAWAVDVLLDGRVIGPVAAGDTRTFGGLATGAHRLEARTPETTFPQEFPVLEDGQTFRWRLRAPGAPSLTGAGGILPSPGTGRLRVENPHPEVLTVRANGAELGTVAGERSRIFDEIASGSVRLSAESADRRTLYQGPVARIEPGRVVEWRIGGGVAGVGAVAGGAPDRRPPEPIAPDLPPRGAELPPGGADLPAGEERLPPGPPPAPAPGVEDPGAAALPPAPPSAEPFPEDDGDFGRDGDGQAAGGSRVFVVENQTTQDLEVLLDGEVVGAVGAGMVERFTDLPSLQFTPSARTASGRRTYPHPAVDLTGRQSFTWIITP